MTPPPVPAWFTAAWWDHIIERIEEYAEEHALFNDEDNGEGRWLPNPPDAVTVAEWISYPSARERDRGFYSPYELTCDTEDSMAQEAADWVLLNAWIAWALEPDSKHTAEQSREIAQDVADRQDERGIGPL